MRQPAPGTYLSDIVNKMQKEESKVLKKFKDNEDFILNGKSGHGIKNDPYKVSNAIVMEINNLAGQLFELSNNLNKLIMYKPKKICKILTESY